MGLQLVNQHYLVRHNLQVLLVHDRPAAIVVDVRDDSLNMFVLLLEHNLAAKINAAYITNTNITLVLVHCYAPTE